MKKCNKCRKTFPKTIEFFPFHKQCKDQLEPCCRACKKQAIAMFRETPQSRTTVYCADCNVPMVRQISALKNWKGRCRSCAQKLSCNSPKMKALRSANATKQFRTQKQIPNAVKLQKGLPPEAHYQYKGGLPQCKECGKRCAAYTSTYCGECMKSHMPKGEQHHNWKGGISGEAKRIRQSTEYKNWRLAVFQRDRFTCVMCGHRSQYRKGKTKCDIRADHIKPFHLFPELRLDVTNGRTLCVECDKIHGYNYNRDRQLLLFG